VTAGTFLIGSLALAGLPPLAGFFSKDEIWVITDEHWGGWAAILFGLAALLTAIYTTRLFIRTFLGEPRDHHVYDHTHESSFVMTGPLVFLAILAVLAGWVIFSDVGEALGFPVGITEFVFSHEPHEYHVEWGFAAASAAIAAGGIFFAGWLYWRGRLDRSTALAGFQPGVYDMLRNKFYFDELYQGAIDRGVLGFSYITSWFDRYVVNDTGVDGSAQVTGYSGYLLKHLQTGRLPNYALGIAVGVVALAVAGLAVRG
jgi:NADH-quinone oxidoreductase subunit L